MRMRYILAIIITAIAAASMLRSQSAQPPQPAAATAVVDSLTGTPLPRATVYDRRGASVGVSNDAGLLPRLAPSAYPLTVRYMGYQPAVVPDPDRPVVKMRTVALDLPEVVVAPGKRDVVHLTAYVREYASLSNYSDTVLMFREKMVDFMLPSKKTRGFKGWLKPRVLDSRSFYHFSNAYGLDSVSDSYRQYFSWADWVGVTPRADVPARMQTLDVAVDTIYGPAGRSQVWRKADDTFQVKIDVLADSLNRAWVPSLASYLTSNVGFTRFELDCTFTDVGVAEILGSNLARMSFVIESYGRGRSMFRIFDKTTPYYIRTYAEVYVTDRRRITAAEARQLERSPALAAGVAIAAPADAPPLDPAIEQMMERVASIDHTGRRLALAPDKRVAGRMDIFDKKPENAAWKYIKSLIGL